VVNLNETTPGPLVALRGVSKSFVEGETRHQVLKDVDLDIAEGSVVALLGRSGSGKSTLLNLISGIDAPDTGSIIVAGTPLQAVGEHERSMFRRRHIGFVFQFFNLLPTLTVEENVLLPMQLNGLEVAGGAARRLLERVGLEDRAGTFPDRLSGGEQQRVAIARALAHDPEILLADEPTGNLDMALGHDILSLLLDLAHDRGKTMLMATHSHEVAATADRVIRLVDHAVVEISKAEL
jgi:putative ABC transport system ATP-binding protein